jgi:hypothetical protein
MTPDFARLALLRCPFRSLPPKITSPASCPCHLWLWHTWQQTLPAAEW